MSSSQLQMLKQQVEELRVEASIQRIPVSQAVADLRAYIEKSAGEDKLLTGISPNENPFREKSGCSIL